MVRSPCLKMAQKIVDSSPHWTSISQTCSKRVPFSKFQISQIKNVRGSKKRERLCLSYAVLMIWWGRGRGGGLNIRCFFSHKSIGKLYYFHPRLKRRRKILLRQELQASLHNYALITKMHKLLAENHQDYQHLFIIMHLP